MSHRAHPEIPSAGLIGARNIVMRAAEYAYLGADAG